MAESWESSSDDGLTDAQQRHRNQQAVTIADAELAGDTFAGVASPGGGVNKRIDSGVCPTCFQSTEPKPKKQVVSATKEKKVVANVWDQISVASGADLDKIAVEVSRRATKNHVSPGTLNRFLKTMIDGCCGSQYDEKTWNQLIQSIQSVKTVKLKAQSEKKVQKETASFMRDPLKAEIDQGCDEYNNEWDDFF